MKRVLGLALASAHLGHLGTRRARIGAALAFLLALGFANAGAAVASANPTVATETRPATARLSDPDNDLLVFVNKSRADLCTPERIIFEQQFLAWLDGGAQGDPPPEPASSQQGIAPVTFTQRTAGDVTTFTIDGRNLPVEVWRLEDDVDGLDCTATDGPGAALFATGIMTWHNQRVTTPTGGGSFSVSLQGRVVGTDGQPYNYSIRYGAGNGGTHLVPIG
jgi:hypothetical protein